MSFQYYFFLIFKQIRASRIACQNLLNLAPKGISNHTPPWKTTTGAVKNLRAFF